MPPHALAPDPDAGRRRGLYAAVWAMSPGPPSRGTGFGEELAGQLADVMFALSTPSRVQILGCLLDGAHSVSELVERLNLPEPRAGGPRRVFEQSSVSHQLRVLREHSLVRVERHGRRRVYTLYDKHVVALLDEAVRHVEERRGKRRGSGAAVAGD